MKKLQIVSDLHLEFGGQVDIQRHAPYLAVLGDIGLPFQPHYAEFIERQSEQFEHVFVLLGNHEYYSTRKANTVLDKVQSICDGMPNVTLLDRKIYALSDKTILVGCTLWSQVDPMISKDFNDFNKIHVAGVERKRKLTIEQYNEWHHRDVEYLRSTIAENQNKDIIVLTHHAPSHKMQGKYSGGLLSSAFATPLEDLITAPVVTWASGHIHSNVDTTINGIRSVSNCKGYKGEDAGYREDVVIEFI